MNIKSDERRPEITLQVLFGLLHHPLHLLPTNFMVLCEPPVPPQQVASQSGNVRSSNKKVQILWSKKIETSS